MLCKIHIIVEESIWNARRPKIKVLQGSKCQGMRLINLRKCDIALQFCWVYKPHHSDPILTCLAYYHINPLLNNELFWKCNFKYDDVLNFRSPSGFWRDDVISWAEVHHVQTEQSAQIMNQIIWLNSCLQTENKPFFREKIYSSGLIYIHQL